jgi:quercetin dioxygenase-like cupin family protein
MQFSRRDFGFLLPGLACAAQQTQQPQAAAPQPVVLPQKVYHSSQIEYTGDDAKKGRRFFAGATHGGFNLEMHETILGAGKETHPPHKHEHEEIVIVVAGTLEVHMEDKSEIAETGSVIWFGSNQMHNARNAGDGPCHYCVVELRGTEAAA